MYVAKAQERLEVKHLVCGTGKLVEGQTGRTLVVLADWRSDGGRFRVVLAAWGEYTTRTTV